MNTYFALLAEFETAYIPLDKVAEKYLGLAPAKAKRYAATQSLPFPVFRDEQSQQRPWLVAATDLAQWLDTMTAKAREEWRKANTAA